MDILKIFLTAVAACIFVSLISQYRPEYALFVQLSAVAVIVLMTSDSVADVFSQTKELTTGTKINSEYINLLIKALIIAVSGKVVCDICSDTGNRAIATCADLACRLCIMLLALPMLKALAQLATELIKG